MQTIICVGAIYIDTLLTVPHFPAEDEKLRANKLTLRRGGNTANTMEVLEQLMQIENSSPREHPGYPPYIELRDKLYLLSVLPDQNCSDAAYIEKSLRFTSLRPFSLYREGINEAAVSYIIQSEANNTRTIVSYNELPEMRYEEFVQRVKIFRLMVEPRWPHGWFHFEGRNPETTLQCVKYLRKQKGSGDLKISVELEKANRTGMAAVAALADVVFYSRSWVEGNNFDNPKAFLEAQLQKTRSGATLFCTWGADGATAVQKQGINDNDHLWEKAKAWVPSDEIKPVVDTVGAGDSFIAGILFASAHHEEWPLRQRLEFANELAGRKVIQHGFHWLGYRMKGHLW